MKPSPSTDLTELSRTKIRAVFSDLDDTLTERGEISGATFEALHALRNAGLHVVLVSGRPSGWADALTRLWPIDAMIFENGAGFLHKNGETLATHVLADISQPERGLLDRALTRLRAEIPGLRLAEDQPYRRFDYAIDICEQAPHLPEPLVRKALRILEEEKGITAKLSSIHINFWAGSYTKVSAAEKVLALLMLPADEAVFVGDSPNDEPLFANFKFSVGVQNVDRYLHQMKSPPRFVTKSPNGAGFRELVKALLAT